MGAGLLLMYAAMHARAQLGIIFCQPSGASGSKSSNDRVAVPGAPLWHFKAGCGSYPV